MRVGCAIGKKLVRQGLSVRYYLNGDYRSEGENYVGIWGKGVPGGGYGKLKAPEAPSMVLLRTSMEISMTQAEETMW